jgi:N utilization substance protein B
MGRRREGREAAVQFLYCHEINQVALGQESLDSFFSLRNASASVREFATELIRGVLAALPEIDPVLDRIAENYELNRLSAVDRNILRLAIYEMLHVEAIPPVVSINEAIEIAKRFGTEESGRFVNGILDRLRKELPAPARRVPKP